MSRRSAFDRLLPRVPAGLRQAGSMQLGFEPIGAWRDAEPDRRHVALGFVVFAKPQPQARYVDADGVVDLGLEIGAFRQHVYADRG